MINKLIKYYSENLILTGLIKKHYPILYFLLIPLYIIFSGVPLYYFFKYSNVWYLLGIIPILILLIICKRYINLITIKKSEINDVSYKRHEMNKLNNYFFEELEKYLKREHLVEIENDIILLLKEKSQSIKIPFIFISGIFSALSLSVFSALCKKLYDISGNINEISIITTLLVLIVILVIYLLYFFRDFYFGYFTEYNKINNLINMLEENKLRRNVETAKNKNCPIII